MCGCTSNFSGNRPSEIDVDNFTGNRPSEIDLLEFDGGGSYTDFVDDVESGERFDNFLTKKSRERKRLRKEAEGQGLSKDEAKAKALEQLPRTSLKELLLKLKKGESVVDVQTPAGNVKLSTDPTKAMNQVADALKNSSAGGTDVNADDSGNDLGFFAKNKKIIFIGVGVVVLGFVAFKFLGNKGANK